MLGQFHPAVLTAKAALSKLEAEKKKQKTSKKGLGYLLAEKVLIAAINDVTKAGLSKEASQLQDRYFRL